MVAAVTPPERNHNDIAQLVSGATLYTGWQRRFYAHLDAFLAAARSIPEIIQCCFGHDFSRSAQSWFATLNPAEQSRRNMFNADFLTELGAFRAQRSERSGTSACIERVCPTGK